MCFIGHEVPAKLLGNAKVLKQTQEIYNKELLWKILEEKELLRETQDSLYRTNMKENEMIEAKLRLEAEIKRLQ